MEQEPLIEHSRRPLLFTLIVGVYEIVSLIFPFVAVILALYHWNDMTSCFQREAFVLSFLCLYWKYSKTVNTVRLIWEFYPPTILLWMVEYMNRK
jgi:hypothetical protein